MLYLLDRDNDTIGYLDGDDCKDLNNNILGHIKRDDNDPMLNYILDKDLNIKGQLYGNEFKENNDRIVGKVIGNDLISCVSNDLLGHIKINDTKDSNNIARAGTVLYFFFPLYSSHYISKYTKAAEKGNVVSQYNLAITYLTGENFVAKDIEKAFYWFNKAAEQGDAQAQFNLGIMYLNGDGVEKDINKAIELFKKAEKGGEEKAKKLLATAEEMKVEEERAKKERIEKEENERKEKEKRELNEKKQKQFNEWIKKGLCGYCGGEMIRDKRFGLFSKRKKCKLCGCLNP